MVKKYYSMASMSNIVGLVAGLIILFTAGVVHATAITYTYDSLNRLTNVDYGNGRMITYTYDKAGNRLTLVSTPPDLTPPSTPLITDDGLYTTNLSQLHAVWTSTDPETGIAEYQYAIGTTPQGTDVVGWTSNGISNSVTHSGLSLLDGVTYYISVKARNGAGLWSEAGSSDGIMALSPAGDPDGDGLTNDEEVNTYGTDPLKSDTDGDGMNDRWEVQYGLNSIDTADALADPDKDGFSNLKEYEAGTNPQDPLSHPPVAGAGLDQYVQTGSRVTLDGSASSGRDANLITFNWTQTGIPTGSTATLSNSNVPKPYFNADKDGNYSYDLTVCDSLYCSDPDSVTFYASVPNVLPNANAGVDQNVLTGAPVLLNGSLSNDPDNGPSPHTYLWSFLNIPAGSLRADADITGSDTPLAGFTPDANGQYRLDLAISDGAATTHDQVIIIAGTLTPPMADAGLDQVIKLGPGATLDGSGSYDQDGWPLPITYQWSFVSIPAGSALANANIINANTISAGFMPDVAGSYVLQLAVSDGQYTATDNVVVIVDGGPPIGSIIINGNKAWTNTTSVALTLNCSDTESSCSQMRFSNDKITWSPWEAYSTSKSWTLPSGDGTKRVYVRYKDKAGNISSIYSDAIKLDTTKPVLSEVLDTPDPFKPGLGEVSTISFTASDNLSGTCTIRARIFDALSTLARLSQFGNRNVVTC